MKIANKVPEITLVFWLIKIMSTTVGETGADYLAFNLGFGNSKTALIMVAILALALVWQISRTRCVPAAYWLSVVLVSIVGTLISDIIVDHFGVSLQTTTAVFSVLLIAVFGLWYREEGTLAINAINTRRRELFYWAAILVTFALGTAAGDLISEGADLGYLTSAIIFALVIALVYGAYLLGASVVWSFWIAYVLTRPFGASVGDLLSQAPDAGGMGFGTVITSKVFLVIILALVGFATWADRRANA